MRQKWISVAMESILGIIGLIFFVMAYNFNDGGTSYYAGAGYYPMLVSGLMVVFSVAALIEELYGKGKKNTKVIDITRIKNVGLVTLAIAIIISIWFFLDLFYVGALIGTAMLLITLEPKGISKKSVIRSLIITVVMCIVLYLTFEYALDIHP